MAIGKALHTNRALIQYLNNLDFREIILKKIAALDIKRLNELSDIFSKKEKEILYQMFGIEEMHRESAFLQSEIYKKLYDQEASDIDRVIMRFEKK